MGIESGIPITDNHLHVDPVSGLGPVQVGRLFSRSGGTHACVVNKMVEDWGLVFTSLEDFKVATSRFLRSVEEMRAETDVRPFAVVGPHPVQLVRLWNSHGPEGAEALMREALLYSGGIVGDGKAMALGEVGRPHFEVPGQILEASNRLLDLSFQIAADVGCAVQVHMETGTPEQFEELATRARSAGLPEERVVRHFSALLASETRVMPSIVATKKNVKSALGLLDTDFLMETDYIDDSRRPGAVLGPRTVPKVTRLLLQEGLLSDESVHRIHVENVQRVYNVEISI